MRTMYIELQVQLDDDDCMAIDTAQESEEELLLWYVSKYADDPEKVKNVKISAFGDV